MFLEEKAEQLQNELFNVRRPVNTGLETENAHLRFLVTEKDGEIRNLKHMVENYKLEIERYTNALDSKRNAVDLENNEMVRYLKDTNSKLEMQNGGLMREIQELRNKIFELQSANLVSEQSLFDKSQRVTHLELTNDRLEKEVASLMARLSAKEPPKVERICEVNKEVRYEADPYIIQKNEELSRELDKALKEEAKAKRQLNELRQQLEEAGRRSGDPGENPKYENLMNFIVKTRPFIKQKNDALMFYLLKLNMENSRLLKIQKEHKNMVLVNQKLEIIDGTLALYYDFVETYMVFIYDIFKNSTDVSFKKKLNSFIVFKEKLIELKSKANYFGLISTFFFRLKNLVYEDLPKLKVVKYDGMKHTEAVLNLDVEDFARQPQSSYEPKKPTLVSKKVDDEFSVNVRPVDFPKNGGRHQMDEWIKATLLTTIQKYKADKESWDKYLLYVFRLLTIKYRVDFPMVKGTRYEVNKDLIAILDTKICAAALNFFTYQNGVNKQK